LSKGVDGDRRQEPGERALEVYGRYRGWEAGFRRWWQERWEPTKIGRETG